MSAGRPVLDLGMHLHDVFRLSRPGEGKTEWGLEYRDKIAGLRQRTQQCRVRARIDTSARNEHQAGCRLDDLATLPSTSRLHFVPADLVGDHDVILRPHSGCRGGCGLEWPCPNQHADQKSAENQRGDSKHNPPSCATPDLCFSTASRMARIAFTILSAPEGK